MAAIRRVLCALVILVGLGLPDSAASRQKPAVEYELAITDPASQYLEVTLSVDGARRKTTDVAMPAWTPGSYKIRDFARHVYGWRAESMEGKPLPISRVDKQTWRVENRRKPFRLHYRVWADELGVRTSYVDDRFAFLNGASVFMYVVGQTERPARLKLSLPKEWPVHTTMARDGDRLVAASYDALVDEPLLLGQAQVESFEVAGAKIDYVFSAPGGSNADVSRLASDAEKIVTAAGEVMGGLPFRHYTFFVIADPVGGGGLEHANSTGIILPPWIFDDDDGYERAQRVAAHEFFHAWNVKRIHDEVLGPFDYSKEVYSDLLWFHEGVTTAMTGRLLLRAGLVTQTEYLESLGTSWTAYAARPGRNAEPISQLSRDAWIKGYRPSKNHRNDAISYYTKGNLVGVALDLELFLRTADEKRQGSLEGMLRRLWADRKKGADDRAITGADLIAAASDEAGEDMTDFFARFVDGTEELPLPSLLERAGLKVDRKLPEKMAERTWTGIVGKGTVIESIDPSSPAATAGLMIDDEIVAVDGSRVNDTEAARARLRESGPGKTHEVTLFRRGRLERRALTTTETPYATWTFEPGKLADWPFGPSVIRK